MSIDRVHLECMDTESCSINVQLINGWDGSHLEIEW